MLLKAYDSSAYPLAPLKALPTQVPRWPSGVSGIDDHVLTAGFYGLAAISGPWKLGKSLLSYQSSMLAASNGWAVVYVDAELDDYQASERIHNATGRKATEWCAENPQWRWRQLLHDACLKTIVEDVVAQVPDGAERVLVVIDSLQSTAEMLVRENGYRVDYFDAMRSIIRWALTARRLSRGACAFLFTSERNTDGDTKGKMIEAKCDILLKLSGKRHERVVALDVELSREGGSGPLGQYVRDWDHCRFVLPERQHVAEPVREIDVDSWFPPPDRRLI